MSGSWGENVATQDDIDEAELALACSIDGSTVEHAVPVRSDDEGFNVDNAAHAGGGHNDDWYCVLNSTDGDDVDSPTGVGRDANHSDFNAVPE